MTAKKRYRWVIKVYHNTIDSQNGVESLQAYGLFLERMCGTYGSKNHTDRE